MIKRLAAILFLFASLAVVVPRASFADDLKAGDLVISQAWSRATPGGAKVGAGYLTIENKGAGPDRLTGGTSEISSKVEVHEMSTENGIMKMHAVEGGLALPSGKTVTLGPGGYHLMFTDLKRPLKQGDTFTATLDFEKAGKVAVTFVVESVGAKGPAGESKTAPDTRMDHSKMKM